MKPPQADNIAGFDMKLLKITSLRKMKDIPSSDEYQGPSMSMKVHRALITRYKRFCSYNF